MKNRWPAWQPIETAPKDGTQVLIFDARANLAPIMVALWEDAAWRCYSTRRWFMPTHWLPLPKSPEQIARENADSNQEYPDARTSEDWKRHAE